MDCNFCHGPLGDPLARKISSELGMLFGNGDRLLGHVGGEGGRECNYGAGHNTSDFISAEA